jgi:Aerotolerance regulator N-terminal
MITLGNPAGLWALAAIPAILAIHFLQRESRRETISTLFLIEQLAPESAAGRRFERLRQSVPLWLQMLAALLIAWLLAQPRWLRRDSAQHVVIVLDSSVSMSAFHDEMLRALATATQRLASAAARTDWHLLESDMERPTLYAGADQARLLQAAAAARSHLGAHDFAPALAAAQALLRGRGILLFVTDRRYELPAGVHLLAVGHPIENCGFTGVVCEGRKWKALVRNYGEERQRRSWWLEAGGQRSPEHELNLAPGETVVVAGEFPAGADAMEAVLSGDAFPMDDRLPMVLPRQKPLSFAISTAAPFEEFFRRLIASFADSATVTAHPDIQLIAWSATAPRWPDGAAIVFAADPATTGKLLAGETVAERDALTADLNWAGLLCRDTLQVPSGRGDRTLVWHGARPLIFLREKGAATQLVVNFDLRSSNADRLPAFVLLLHRFAERIRASKFAAESRNVETNQLLTVASRPGLPAPVIPGETEGVLRAPAFPRFFAVRQGDAVLLTGAAQFSDAREADFRKAASFDGLGSAIGELVERNSRSDILSPVWVLALGAAMIGSWVWSKSP